AHSLFVLYFLEPVDFRLGNGIDPPCRGVHLAMATILLRNAAILGFSAVAATSAGCMQSTNNQTAQTPQVAAASTHVRVPKIERIGGRAGAGGVLAKVDGRKIAYIADADDRSIRVIDLENQKELSTLPLPGAPAMLALLADGRIVATLRDANELAVIGGAGTHESPLQIDKRVKVAVEPIGLTITPDEATLLVTSGWGHTL